MMLALMLLPLVVSYEGTEGDIGDCPWLSQVPEDFKPPIYDTSLHVLTDADFEESTLARSGKGDSWYISFTREPLPRVCEDVWAEVADELAGTAKVGFVDLTTNPFTATRFEEFTKDASSTTLFLHLGDVYHYHGPCTTEATIMFAINEFMHIEDAPRVPPPPLADDPKREL